MPMGSVAFTVAIAIAAIPCCADGASTPLAYQSARHNSGEAEGGESRASSAMAENGYTPPSGFLPNPVRDWLAVIGVVGVLLTALGVLWSRQSLVLAARQLRITTTANEAATTAAIQALQHSRNQYDRHLVKQAHTLLQSAKIYVDVERWGSAAMRLGDLADALTQLAMSNGQWRDLADRSRQMEDTFNRVASSDTAFAKGLQTKWRDLCHELSAKIVEGSAPFPLNDQDQTNVG